MSQSKLKIRAAARSDAKVILDLIQALAEFEKLAHEVVATEEKLRATLFSGHSSAEVLIAELKEGGRIQVAGFALFFSNYSTFLAQPGIYIEDLFVKPEFRSQGIGAKILSHLASLAVARNCGRLEWSVLDWNRRARDFYEDLGAKPMTEWTVHRLTGQALVDLANKA